MTKPKHVAAISIALLAIFAGFNAYFFVPRFIGNIRVQSVKVVPFDVLKRLIGDNIGDEGSSLLRIEVSSDTDLVSRTFSVSGVDDLYAGSSPCPFGDNLRTWSMTRGPFPDDQSQYLAGRLTRHASFQKTGGYKYTVYVATNVDDLKNDLCVKIKGSSFYSPHVESSVFRVSQKAIRHAVHQSRPG
ncbi:MAG: hypothetical protein ACRCSO_06020 [Sphingomonas sp.]